MLRNFQIHDRIACEQAHLGVTRERRREKRSGGKESREKCSNVSLIAGYDRMEMALNEKRFFLLVANSPKRFCCIKVF